MKTLLAIFLVLGLLLAARPWSATAAPAATIVVNSLSDAMILNGNCTLREAVEAANTNMPVDGCRRGSAAVQDTITFRASGTVLLTEALWITEGVAIQGNGQDMTILDGQDAPPDAALLMIPFVSNPDIDVSLSALTLQHAPASAVFSGADVVLGLDQVTLRHNAAPGGVGAGIKSLGTLNVSRSLFVGNTAGGAGGAISATNGPVIISSSVFEGNAGQSGGALRVQDAALLVTRSTFSGNQATDELGVGGAFALGNSTAVVSYSAIVANHAAYAGGGLELANSRLTLTNSTVHGNTAVLGGGMELVLDSVLEAHHSTLTNNAPEGVVLWSSTASFENMLVGANGMANCSVQPGSTLQSLGHNLIDVATCHLDQPTDLAVGTAVFEGTLGPLQDNGGPTPSRAPLLGSPAIDSGTCSGVSDDQRGVARPQGDGCDRGAFEYDGAHFRNYQPVILR